MATHFSLFTFLHFVRRRARVTQLLLLLLSSQLAGVRLCACVLFVLSLSLCRCVCLWSVCLQFLCACEWVLSMLATVEAYTSCQIIQNAVAGREHKQSVACAIVCENTPRNSARLPDVTCVTHCSTYLQHQPRQPTQSRTAAQSKAAQSKAKQSKAKQSVNQSFVGGGMNERKNRLQDR